MFFIFSEYVIGIIILIERKCKIDSSRIKKKKTSTVLSRQIESKMPGLGLVVWIDISTLLELASYAHSKAYDCEWEKICLRSNEIADKS